jgi:radical SAM-linked protein
MKARMQFAKTGSIKFLGHLDVMRYFQKLFKRSGLDVAYSKGYNPHPILSFASPLGVGATSEGEYLDIELNSLGDKTPDEWVRCINEESNAELKIRNMILLSDGAKTSMSLLAAADYIVSLKEGYYVCDDLRERFLEFLSRDSIPIIKQTKKSEKKIDLKEYIYDIIDSAKPSHWKNASRSSQTEMTADDTIIDSAKPNHWKNASRSSQTKMTADDTLNSFIFIRLAAGSVVNIKPELLLKAFCEDQGVMYEPFAYQVHRVEMYADVNAAKGEINSNSKRELRKLVSLKDRI